MMSDRLFMTMIVVGLVMIAAGWALSNTGRATKHESCGVGGLMILFGIVLVLIPLGSVLFALVFYQSGWL